MTVLCSIRYEGGVIIGADRLICLENGKKIDQSKIICRKNYLLALTGRTTKQINVFERHNKFWTKLDDFLEDEPLYEKKLEIFSDFFSSINLGLKQIEVGRQLSTFANNRNVRKYDLEMSFLCTLRYKNQTQTFFDLGRGNIDGQISYKRSIITTPEKIDFTLEYAKSREYAQNRVYEKILLANKRYPAYCSGIEIIDFTIGGSKLIYQESIN